MACRAAPNRTPRRLTTLKVFFAWLAESGVLPTDPAAPVIHERPTTPLPEILYDEQVNALLKTARICCGRPSRIRAPTCS